MRLDDGGSVGERRHLAERHDCERDHEHRRHQREHVAERKCQRLLRHQLRQFAGDHLLRVNRVGR